MAEGRDLVMETAEEGTSASLLYRVELVYDRGVYMLIVRDLVQGTLQTTTVPGRTVAKIPMYLSKLDLRQH
ncbi:hypothetical protein ACH47Z_20410 [Streptomyces sp. NPDC020192]|uniref:hypothetical protein n=1 Tax=Streptomyces sp. NPDC020192 TaxID=3365066 RepID=UPI0037BDBF94